MTVSKRIRTFQILAGVSLALAGYVVGRLVPKENPLGSPTADMNVAAHPASDAKVPSALDCGDGNASGPTAWSLRWQQISTKPHSPATDLATAKALEELAAQDPARALALALKERNRRRRTDWLHAVLCGWATVAPKAAAAWVATLPSAEREGAESAVMDGAVHNPGSAVALAQQLAQSDPANARSHANHLLRALEQSGDYETSVDFAFHLPEQIRAEMLGTAFQYWALSQPERALDVAMKLPPGDARKTALDAAISGWSQGDPSGLAEFALSLSSTEDRTEALQTALREWVQINPKAASEWIDKFDPKPELDAGAAAVALQSDVLAKNPEIAASWAESITSAELRLSTLTNVLREWANKDASAAMNYARMSTGIQPAEREALLAELNRSPAQ